MERLEYLENQKKKRGAGKYDEGLYNDQIETYLKKRIDDFVPVIASDEIDTLKQYIRPNMKRFGWIMNTATSISPGEHWVAFYINNEDDYQSIEYYDSFGEKLPKSIENKVKEIARIINPETMFKFKYNRIQMQPDKSGDCGWYAIKFLDKRFNGIPFSEATYYDKFIEKMKKQIDMSGQGQKEIDKYKKMWGGCNCFKKYF
jgi:hypothetical protein